MWEPSGPKKAGVRRRAQRLSEKIIMERTFGGEYQLSFAVDGIWVDGPRDGELGGFALGVLHFGGLFGADEWRVAFGVLVTKQHVSGGAILTCSPALARSTNVTKK